MDCFFTCVTRLGNFVIVDLEIDRCAITTNLIGLRVAHRWILHHKKIDRFTGILLQHHGEFFRHPLKVSLKNSVFILGKEIQDNYKLAIFSCFYGMDPSLLLVQRCWLLTHAIYMLCRQTALLQDKPLAHRLKHCCRQLLTHTIQGHLDLRDHEECAKQVGIYAHLIGRYVYGAYSL